MAVVIGSVTLEVVLDWDEDEEMTIPIKRIVRKTTSGTTQSDFPTRTPRHIIITAKHTTTTKLAIRNLKNQAVWQTLYDYDGTFVDHVWMEKLRHRWRGDQDHNYPWVMTLDLICSTT